MDAQQLITSILDYLRVSPTEFARNIGLERAQAIFDMRDGKTKTVSRRMAERIKEAYPAFSAAWIAKGEGEMLESEMPEEAFGKRSTRVAQQDITQCVTAITTLTRQCAEKDRQIAKLLDMLTEKDRLISQLLASREREEPETLKKGA